MATGNEVTVTLDTINTAALNMDGNARMVRSQNDVVEGTTYNSKFARWIHKTSSANDQMWTTLRTALSDKYDADIVSRVMPENIDTTRPLTARAAKQIIRSANDEQIKNIAMELGDIFLIENVDIKSLEAQLAEVAEQIKPFDERGMKGGAFNGPDLKTYKSLYSRQEALKEEIINLKQTISRKGELNSRQMDLAIQGLGIRGRCSYLTELFRSDLTRLSGGEISGDTKAEDANRLVNFLPQIQTLAKTSADDFEAYRNLVSAAGKLGLIDPDLLEMGTLKPEQTMSLLQAFTDNIDFQEQEFIDTELSALTKHLLGYLEDDPELESEWEEYNQASEDYQSAFEAYTELDAEEEYQQAKADMDNKLGALISKGSDTFAESLDENSEYSSLKRFFKDNEELTPQEVNTKLNLFAENRQIKIALEQQEWMRAKVTNILLPQIRDIPFASEDARKEWLAQYWKDDPTQQKLMGTYVKTTITNLKTDLQNCRPRSEQDRNLRDTLLAKYKDPGPDSITERDLRKMSRLIGDTHKQALNMCIMTRYALKGGNIKTTEYVPTEIKESAREMLGGKIKTQEDLERSWDDLKNAPPEELSPEGLQYLVNKIKKRIHDLLPKAAGDPRITARNRNIIQALTSNLFMAPHRLRFEMLTIKRAIGSGGSDAMVYNAGTKRELMEGLRVHVEGSTGATKKDYQTWMDHLNDLTRNVNLSQDLAFKCFKLRDFLTEQEKLKEFLKEYNTARRLSHENIVNTYFSIEEGDRIGIVMDLCANGDVEDVLTGDEWQVQREKIGAFAAAKQKIGWILGAAIGIQHMHEVGIVHRDIKPQNIFLTRDNVAKVGDFGLSKDIDSSIEGLTHKQIKERIEQGKGKDKLDSDTKRIGTSLYIPPEIVSKNYKASPSQDMHSMAMTALAIMLGGEKEFQDGGFNFELKAARDPGFLKKFINNHLDGDNDFNNTANGQRMKALIKRAFAMDLGDGSADFEPDKRISFPEFIQELKAIYSMEEAEG